MESDCILRLVITGRVQGVGFRAFAASMAEARGVRGWVRNRRDGAVEAVLAGSNQAVAATVADLEAGPPGGRIDKLESRPETPAPDAQARLAQGFLILPTV